LLPKLESAYRIRRFRATATGLTHMHIQQHMQQTPNTIWL
jgi:hypothetical protein